MRGRNLLLAVLAAGTALIAPGLATAVDSPPAVPDLTAAPPGALPEGVAGLPPGPGTQAPQRGFVPGELLVGFKKDASASERASVRRRNGATAKHALPIPGVQSVKLKPGTSVAQAAAAFERDPNVRYAEPNYYANITSTIPDDPKFGELWGLNNTGQPHFYDPGNGTPDADIDAPEAWDTTTGSPSVTVAIVDTGIAYDHPDLDDNIWANPGESGGGKETNGLDDDNNGFVDDFRGWDFISDDNNPNDYHYHGTHVAGTVAAEGNNGTGVAGVTWSTKLMPIRVLGTTGGGTSEGIAAGFDYAGDNGADVVNASIGGPPSQVEQDAVAAHPDTLYVFAAGNGASLHSSIYGSYPCDIPEDNVICVAASGQRDEKALFTDYGVEDVDLFAPGFGVYSTFPAFADPSPLEGFEDDISTTWVTGGTKNTWARTDEDSNTGDYSLTDSPGANYQTGTNSWARTADPIDLSGKEGCKLFGAFKTDFGTDGANFVIESSGDGVQWSEQIRLAFDTNDQYYSFGIDLSQFDGQSAYARFKMDSHSGGTTADGIHIDDLSLQCATAPFDGDEYGTLSGTSMASPHVAGAAALVAANVPGIATANLKQRLLRTVDFGPTFDAFVGSGGRLNVRRALDYSPPATPSVSSISPASPAADEQPKVIGSADPGSTVRIYRSPDCTGGVAAVGTAAEFASPGLQARVAKAQTVSFYANASTEAGGTSDCSASSVGYANTGARTVLRVSNRCKIKLPDGSNLVSPCVQPIFGDRWSVTKTGKLATAYRKDCPGVALGKLSGMKTIVYSDRDGNTAVDCADPSHPGLVSIRDVITDASGKRIVFSADSKVQPGTFASYQQPAVIMYQKGQPLKQISLSGTSGHGGAISGDGKTVVYSSSGNPTGGNADGNVELFSYKPDTNQRTQITDTAGSCFNGTDGPALNNASSGPSGPSLSKDGNRIAFISNCDLTAGNGAGEWRAFVYEASSDSITQLDHCTGDCDAVTAIGISGDGLTVANYDRNGTGAQDKVWLVVNKLAAGSNSAISSQTHGPIVNGDFSHHVARFDMLLHTNAPALTYDGRRIAFPGAFDPVGSNPDRGLEAFLLDDIAGTPAFTQVTDIGAGDVIGAAINEKGNTLYSLLYGAPVAAYGGYGIVQAKLKPLK